MQIKLKQKGFTLIEVCISMVVLAFLSLAIYKMQVSNQWGISESSLRTEAIQTSGYIIDSLKVLGLGQVTTGTNTECGRNTTLSSTRHFLCSSQFIQVDSVVGFNGTKTITSKTIEISVKWKINGAEHSYSTQTVFR